jgi:hypothetical protein
MTAKIDVHHIRPLKDLEQYDGREKPQWVQIMAARRRKTLVLCILISFAQLDIVVGTHYFLPAAAPLALAGAFGLAIILRTCSSLLRPEGLCHSRVVALERRACCHGRQYQLLLYPGT